jgi:hypothetical protein
MKSSNDEMGILITEENGRFIVTPAGGLDLSQINQDPDIKAPISIRSNLQYLVTLTEDGKICVCPSGRNS